jgi:CDP-glycerol glycerophosphotransferase (TagB/SpsB family)
VTVPQVAGNRYLLFASQIYALSILRPLQEAVRRGGGQAAWFFDGPGADYLRDDERLLESVERVRAFDPIAVYVPGNSVPDFFPGIKVEVFHGFSVGKRSDNEGHFRIRGLFDLYCTQGSTTTRRFRQLARRHKHFHVEETGWPKVDPLFDGRDRGPNPWAAGWAEERPILLYASTFTRGLSSAPALAAPIRRLSREGRWNWLVTLHPKMPGELVQAYEALEGPHLRFARTDDVLPLLQAADAMVSDTSSIVDEFLLLHKPAVTLRNRRPGPHLIDIQEPGELVQAIETALARPAELIGAIEEFAEAIHPYRDGRSSERVLQATHAFLDQHRARLRPKPVNLWRKVRLRRRLGYYHWR